MPVLTRLVPAPLSVEVRAGALDRLTDILAEGRISASGSLALVVSTGTDERLRARVAPQLPGADWFPVEGGTLNAAVDLADRLRAGTYDAVVGIGGGRTLDSTKYAAARVGLPMVAVATNLAHDGIASPVSILDNDAGRGSYGVPAPIALVVDLDVIRGAPARYVRAGIGEVLSNLSALADWELAEAVAGQPVDGLSAAFARTAAESLLHRPGGIADDAFLVALVDSLVMSGLAMTVAGTSHPCSGACHEISHALDLLYPKLRGLHGEQVGVGAVFASFLRDDLVTAETLATSLRRHGLPVVPAELGISTAQFRAAVEYAPSTRPGRYTILEHLAFPPARLTDAVEKYVHAFGG
ncbi:iron-containing alcohol dehydrogenase family protein [Streptodolium elevatio]